VRLLAHASSKLELRTYPSVLLGKCLSSRIVGSRPSIPSACSPAPLPQPTLGDLFGVPFCPLTLPAFCITPSWATSFPSSFIFACIWLCTSATARRFGTFSRSFRSCIMSSRKFKFSVRRRETSDSRQRMRTDCVELLLLQSFLAFCPIVPITTCLETYFASSRFCLIKRRLTIRYLATGPFPLVSNGRTYGHRQTR
jgi:hypothetical protein